MSCLWPNWPLERKRTQEQCQSQEGIFWAGSFIFQTQVLKYQWGVKPAVQAVSRGNDTMCKCTCTLTCIVSHEPVLKPTPNCKNQIIKMCPSIHFTGGPRTPSRESRTSGRRRRTKRKRSPPRPQPASTTATTRNISRSTWTLTRRRKRRASTSSPTTDTVKELFVI